MLAAVLPWTSRSVRQAHVREAREGADEARAKAAEARQLGQEIRRQRHQVLAYNHLADIIRSEFYGGGDSDGT